MAALWIMPCLLPAGRRHYRHRHARQKPGVAASTRREMTYTDSEGRFFVLVPVAGAWPLTAADSGFRPVTQQVSASATEPIVFKLFFTGTGPELPEQEQLSRMCCGSPLFTDRVR